MTPTALASLSNNLVYASMVTYAASMVLFAASLASTRGRPASEAAVRAATRPNHGRVAVAERPLRTDGVTRRADLVPGRRAGNIGMSLTWLGTLLLGAGVVFRGLSVDRAPWGNMYEFSIASAFAVSATFLVLSLRRDLRWLGLFMAIPVVLTLGLAITVLYTDAEQLVPALNSYWLVIHVAAAIICAGAFGVGAAVTGLFLVADTGERRSMAGRPYWGSALSLRLPDSTRLDAIAYRIHAFTFPLWTFAVVAGAIWAENAWGRYWGWDPKETWAFITWVGYAAYLHARATAGWRGRKAAVIALVAFAAFLFNYFGVNIVLTGLHSYGGLPSG
jgi:cytochrome c-type biogenesis protein CcsB